eukprot:CAMPEP_0176344238 /NCGR_PEP_ID=MMETSP0126-20121128/4549_1 /TAXON_ID=141414 ORGANISM="Strombidinopsis acuminatum, Strain SPMC142" /NCGR_SAMPLE_ID=MMETSP0126 /ASSEMBLY_ACC=CAM_ASM_000229 /LENGTH=69 /DNA_ID=CAMNT_0017690597 /DNA_START=503 /DNA_END=712 /DNA_ORIENTATION=-
MTQDSEMRGNLLFKSKNLSSTMICSSKSRILKERREPNEEFFHMLLLAYKLSNKNVSKVMYTDGQDLYK